MIESMPFIDDNGTIRVHTRGGGVAILDFETDAGTPRDMSTASVWFETEGFQTQLTVGDQPHQLVLTVDVGDLNHLLNKPTEYVIVDRTTNPDQIIFSGKVSVVGWS